MHKLRIGLAQINTTVGDFENNSHKILEYISRAENKSLDLVVFPELSLCSYPVWDLANKKRFVDKGLEKLSEITRQTRSFKVAAVLGFIDKIPGEEKSYNALAIIQGGKIIHKQYKTLLPTYDVFLEEIFFKAAQVQKICNFRGIKLGTSICEDLWDENYKIKPIEILAQKGAKIIINISASPFYRNKIILREKLIRRQAKKNKIWIVYVNQVGGQDDLIFDGQSLLLNPKGEIVFKGEAFQEGLYEIEIDLEKPSRPKKIKEVYTETDELRDIYQALQLGIKDYVRKNGFKKVVIGLSGGIDSALTATLASDALGAGNVVGVSMPGPFSSPSSLEDAKRLAENLGIEFRVKPINDLYKVKVGSEKKAGEKITVAMENLQARLRALELMFISNQEGFLLLSTGNKSEVATGYCTLYGDMCGGLNVLGDVYKTDVYKLAEYRNSLGEIIPRAVLEKVPTAELRPNQKDQDSLPPYEILDKILHGYIEKNMDKDKIIKVMAKEVQKPVIDEVLSKVDHNEYKRRQSPPTLKVTEKAWFGRRMPITNRFKE